VLEEFRKMRQMSPEEQDKYLTTPDVANRFSPDERDLLKRLGTFVPLMRPNPGGPPPGPPLDPLSDLKP